MTLYLKYRPQTIDELDLASVREYLTKLSKSKEFPHAFLFSGPRGTGKTSAARILAKIINCEKGKDEPCNECEQCVSIMKGQNIDVIEMDGASNRGIDDIRALKNEVALSAAVAKKKIYIIDEVHMLTTEAANALLKTLEEPPGHVMFILATTDPQKLPPTILSRATQIKFTKANSDEVKRQLVRVAKGEKIEIEESAMEIIAKASDGSFRDAVKMVEMLALENKKITNEMAVAKISGDVGILEMVEMLIEGNSKGAFEWLGEKINKGVGAREILEGIIMELDNKLNNIFDSGENGEIDKIVNLMELSLVARSQMAVSPLAELPIKIMIARNYSSVKTGGETQNEGGGNNSKETNPPTPAASGGQGDDNLWTSVVQAARHNTGLDALLRACKPRGFDGNTFTLGVYYQFHKEKLEGGANKIALENILTQVVGKSVNVNYILVEQAPRPVVREEPLTSAKEPDIIKAAEEIFG
jgi:DNA polymerase III subunit gamma/tau